MNGLNSYREHLEVYLSKNIVVLSDTLPNFTWGPQINTAESPAPDSLLGPSEIERLPVPLLHSPQKLRRHETRNTEKGLILAFVSWWVKHPKIQRQCLNLTSIHQSEFDINPSIHSSIHQSSKQTKFSLKK